MVVALNWIPTDCHSPDLHWQADRISDAFSAAESKRFKLVLFFDMSYTAQNCITAWNETYMASVIERHMASPASYQWDSKGMLVSSFAGDSYGDSFFQSLKDVLSGSGTNIVLAPALQQSSEGALGDLQGQADFLVSQYPILDGFFNCALHVPTCHLS